MERAAGPGSCLMAAEARDNEEKPCVPRPGQHVFQDPNQLVLRERPAGNAGSFSMGEA